MNKKILLSSFVIISLSGCQSTGEKQDNINKEDLNQAYPLIKFDKNKSDLSSKNHNLLINSQKVLSHHKDVNMNIEGRASTEGEESYNKNLSDKRVKSTLNYFNEKGIPSNRITHKSLGENDQIPSPPEKEKERNRTVKIKLLKEKK